MTRALRTLAWLPVVALIVLAARAIAYALAPGPAAVLLQHRAGGPTLPVVAGVSLVLGVAVSAIVVWLAWSAVRERHALGDGLDPAPVLRPWRLAITAPALFLTSCAAFTALESYLHERAGLGMHGLSCLFGPVHRNALPLLAALALLAAALDVAARHVLAWARRTARALARPRVVVPQLPAVHLPPAGSPFLSAPVASSLGARAPPAVQPA
jgi:hypothetical protein